MFKLKSVICSRLCFALLFIFICSCSSNKATTQKSKTIEKEEQSLAKGIGFDYGKTKNGKYTNSYFGFELDVPKDWVVQNQEQIEMVENFGKNAVAGDNEIMKAIIKASEINSATLLQVFNYELGTPVDYNSNMTIIIENVKLFPGIKTGHDYLTSVRKLLQQSQIQYEQIDEEFTPKMFSEQEFYLMNTTVIHAGNSIRQRYYATVLKDFALGIVVSYVTPEQEKEIDAALNTLTFKKQ